LFLSLPSAERFGRAAEAGDGGPGADEVDGYGEIFDGWVAEEDAEDVEGVVAVVGEGERMDDGVVVDD